MTYEFTPVVEQSFDKRDPTEFIPWMRCTETPYRVGKLLIVRPLKMIDDFRKLPEGADPTKWRGQLCIADVACLDPIEPAVDDQGAPLIGYAPGTQFRDQTIFLGHLNGAFKNYLGKTCLGTVYTVPSGFAKPSVKWRDLSGDQGAVARAQNFLMSFPGFLIPTAGQITAVAPQNQQQQAAQGYATPASAPPQGNWQGQPDPWAQGAAQPVSPAPQGQSQAHPHQGMSTLEQLKAEAQYNAQGFAQSQEPPF